MTLAFITLATLLVLLASAALILPLLRRNADEAVVERNEANLQVLRDQLAELDADLASGALSQEQYDNARAELEQRTLDESQRSNRLPLRMHDRRPWLAPVLVGVLVPVLSIVMYLQLGNTSGLDVGAFMEQRIAEVTPDKVGEMTQRLAEHLEANPDDAEGWTMMGRARRALQQFDASAQAWERAAALRPDDAEILTNYAEAIALTAQGDLRGEPTRLLARALQLDPVNAKALALSGSAAFARGDYRAAIGHWQKLLALSSGDDELSDALRSAIIEAQSRISQSDDGGAVAVTGQVSLSPKLSKSVNPDDTVFIFARAAEGPGMPLAVERVKASELPYRFRLDDSMAISPERKISDVQQLVIGARVSKNAGATRTSGDFEGFSATVGSGANEVDVVIDRRVP